jgi:hypothetical protein
VLLLEASQNAVCTEESHQLEPGVKVHREGHNADINAAAAVQGIRGDQQQQQGSSPSPSPSPSQEQRLKRDALIDQDDGGSEGGQMFPDLPELVFGRNPDVEETQHQEPSPPSALLPSSPSPGTPAPASPPLTSSFSPTPSSSTPTPLAGGEGEKQNGVGGEQRSAPEGGPVTVPFSTTTEYSSKFKPELTALMERETTIGIKTIGKLDYVNVSIDLVGWLVGGWLVRLYFVPEASANI